MKNEAKNKNKTKKVIYDIPWIPNIIFERGDYNNIFSKRLCDTMQEKKITQKHLAEQLDVSRTTIQNYCYGKMFPDIQNLAKISVVLGVTVDYLLGISDIRTKDVDRVEREELKGLGEQAIRKLEAWSNKHAEIKQKQKFDNMDALNMLLTAKYSDNIFHTITDLLNETYKQLAYIEDKIEDGSLLKEHSVVGNVGAQTGIEKELEHTIWRSSRSFEELLKQNLLLYVNGGEYETRSYREYKY